MSSKGDLKAAPAAKKPRHDNNANVWLKQRWLIGALLLAVVSYGAPQLSQYLEASSMAISPKKPLDRLSEFRELHRREHQNQANIHFHVAGITLVLVFAVMQPELLISAVFAVRCGQIAYVACRSLDSGVPELLVLLLSFVAMAKFLSHSAKPALLAIGVMLLFSMTGHVIFEGKGVLAVYYPTFTLICDLLMWVEWISGVKVLL